MLSCCLLQQSNARLVYIRAVLLGQPASDLPAIWHFDGSDMHLIQEFLVFYDYRIFLLRVISLDVFLFDCQSLSCIG